MNVYKYVRTPGVHCRCLNDKTTANAGQNDSRHKRHTISKLKQ